MENARPENARNYEYGKPIILKYIFLNHSFTPLGFLNSSIVRTYQRDNCTVAIFLFMNGMFNADVISSDDLTLTSLHRVI